MVIKMTNSKLDKHPNIKWFLYSLFKIIFIAYIVVFIIWLIIDHYAVKPKSIYTKVGNNISVSVPIKQTLIIREYAINKFVYYGKELNYEAQYNMLTDEYKSMVTFEQYTEQVKGIDWESFTLKELKAKTDYCFEAYVTYNDNDVVVDTVYLLYTTKYNTEDFKISPNKYVFGYANQISKHNGIEVEVSSCMIYMDKIILNATIRNKSLLSRVDIAGINVSYNGVMTKKQKMDFVLETGEEKQISIEYKDLNYFIPNMVQVEKRKDDKSIKELNFELKEVEK